jgi:hypothetical protein
LFRLARDRQVGVFAQWPKNHVGIVWAQKNASS